MSANEPKENRILEDSLLLHLPACETKSTPEELLAELVVEVFFPGECRGRTQNNFFGPSQESWVAEHPSESDRFLLSAGRGRFRKSTAKSSTTDFFYAPIFPDIARGGAIMRNKGARVINGMLLGGIWASGTAGKDTDIHALSEAVVKSLVGCTSDSDLLSVAVSKVSEEAICQAVANTHALIANAGAVQSDVTEFGKQATKDFIEIAALEPALPRPLWIQLLMCYIRTTVCLWSLQYCQSMAYFKRRLLMSLAGEEPRNESVAQEFSRPSTALLQISSNYDDCIKQLVETYQRDRVEVFECLSRISKSEAFPETQIFERCSLTISGGNYPDENLIDLEDFFHKVSEASTDLWQKLGDDGLGEPTVESWSIMQSRWASAYSSHQRPAQDKPKSAGTNLRYLMNCARRSAGGDDRASHLFETQKRKSLLWRVLPGPLAIQMFVHLASRANSHKNRRLTIGDLFDHLSVYRLGTDTEAGRSAILYSLESMGLLKGSPDAGASLPIQDPFGGARP